MSATERPNVIWIFGDQHRAQAQGHMGDPNVYTPTMDRMAAGGVVFDNAVAGNPWCTPFRGSLLTSRYPHQCCVRTPQRMDPSYPTVARPFNEAGYDTAYIGKWHLDGKSEAEGRSALHVIPRERRGGFNTWIAYENNNDQFDCYVHGHDRNGDEVDLHKLPGYETDALTDIFIDHLRAKGEARRDAKEKGGEVQPFFAVLSVQPPHDPYVAEREWMDRHTPGEVKLRPNVPPIAEIQNRARRDLAGYYAMIENLDWNIQRVRDALEAEGLADNTHIMFFSDHGDSHGSHGCFRKSNPWEESIRVPFIIAGAGTHYDGRRVGRFDSVINHVDIAPTTLGLCGIDRPDWMDGFDYSAYRFRESSTPLDGEPDSAFLQHCVRKFHLDGIDRTWRGVVTRDRWKYVCIPHQPLMLFNLNEDPYELNNLALNVRYEAERRQLQDRLAQWISDTGDEFDLPKL